MITFDSEMEKLPPERRARIEARTQELLKQANMIRLLREELGWSQSDLAERLGVQQSTVSKLENAPESITLGKLANVVTALGGEWKIVLKFPTTEEIELSSTGAKSLDDNSNL
jgi:transcriptional regulator with XRE-family HTH domain